MGGGVKKESSAESCADGFALFWMEGAEEMQLEDGSGMEMDSNGLPVRAVSEFRVSLSGWRAFDSWSNAELLSTNKACACTVSLLVGVNIKLVVDVAESFDSFRSVMSCFLELLP